MMMFNAPAKVTQLSPAWDILQADLVIPPAAESIPQTL